MYCELDRFRGCALMFVLTRNSAPALLGESGHN
jgi:hypothetical protein